MEISYQQWKMNSEPIVNLKCEYDLLFNKNRSWQIPYQ